MTKQPAVYILASKRNGTLYIGVTSAPEARLGTQAGFSRWFYKEICRPPPGLLRITRNMLLAIQREKQIKKWNRAWKLELIEKHNSDWSDLWPAIV